MKALRSFKLVSFGGSVYSDDIGVHRQDAHVARKLEDIGFGQYVATTITPNELADGEYHSCTYYDSGTILVSDKEFEALRQAGVRNLRVHGIYQGELSRYADILFYFGLALVATWNVLLVLAFIDIV